MKTFTKLLLLVVVLAAWGNVVNAENNECGGWTTEAAEGAFTLGYNYSFKTVGTDVTFTCECLDTKVGLVAYAWTYNPNFAEAAMTMASGQKFSKTFSGQTVGTTFSAACKFAFAGGMAVTKTFTYTVGSDCGLTTDTEAPTAFTATAGALTKSSVELVLNATDNNGGGITYSISYGSVPTVLSTTGISGTQKSYAVTGLTAATAYTFSITAKDAAGNTATNSPISVTATTATPDYTIASWPAVAAGFSVDNLTDGVATTNWKVATKTVSYLTFMYVTPKVFNTIALTSGENTGRDPKDWTIEASNDTLVGWTTLDTQTAQTFASTTTVKTYSFANATAYKFYRMHTTSVNGSSSSTNLGELAFSDVVIVIQAPTVSAPTPPAYSAAKVISVFSDAYPKASGTNNFNPGWGQSTVQSIIQIGADSILKYANLNYQGTEFGNHITPISMKYLHLDLWTADETSIQVFPICWTGTGNEAEKFKALSTITLNQWNSFDIPLTDFTSQGLTMADVYQLKIVGSGGKTVFLDNIYFYDNSADADTQAPTAFTATAGALASDAVELLLNATDNSGVISYTISYGSVPTVLTVSGVSGTQKSYTVTGLNGSTAYDFAVTAKDLTGNAAANSPITVHATTLAALPAAPTPTVAASKVISIFSDAYSNVAGTNFYPGWGQTTFASAATLGGNSVMKYATFNYQGIELGSHLDASTMNKLHIDIYPTTETTIRLTPISPSHELPTSLGTLTANVWNSIDVSLSTYTGVVTSDIYQFKFDGGTGGTFYMDNLYFFTDITGVKPIAERSNELNCYPNPVVGPFTVSAKAVMNEVTVRNLLGQSVKSTKLNSTDLTLDLSDLSAGNYFVTVKMADGKLSTHKLVKL